MKKKTTVLLIFFILCVFVMSGCTGLKNGNSNPSYSDVVLSTDSSDLKTISAQVMKDYFEEFKDKSVTESERIDDYAVLDISNIEGDTEKFSFEVNYSIKPFAENTDWIAGNGEEMGEWIVSKFAFVDVEKTESGYIITNMATGK